MSVPRETYVLRDGQLVPKRLAPPLLVIEPSSFPCPHIMSDLPAYESTLADPRGPKVMIEGRAARREEMKRHGVREVDPSEGVKLMERRAQKAEAAKQKVRHV